MGDGINEKPVNEKPVERADQRVLVHDICDAYQRDRQSDPSISMQSYIEQVPDAIKNWVLKELLAIDLDILEMSGETPKRDLLFVSAGVSTASFDEAWAQLQQEGVDHVTINDAAETEGGEETRTRRHRSGLHSTEHYQGPTLAADSVYSTIGESKGGVAKGSIAKGRADASKSPALVADDFELLNMLGEGGMGIVYRAYQHSLQRQVALKLIPQRCMNSKQVIARFYIEAEAAAAMDHPGIVPVYEFGERNGIHYYAMALVEGGNLSKYVGNRKRSPIRRMAVRQIAEIMRKVALAVQYAHDHAVIHRDIKPANILVNAEGEPRLADFGLAKNLDKKEENLTLTGNVLGTPAYMSPEQASGGKIMVSNRTDVYALGATIYALLAARPPFEGGGQYEIVKKVLESNPPSLKEVAPGAPLDLQTICEKCLSKRPQDRYHSAKDVADDLQRYLDGYPISARPVGPLQRIASWCRRNPAIASLIGSVWTVLLVGVMVSTYFWFQAEESAFQANESAEKRKGYLSHTFEIVNDELSGDDPVSQSARQALLGDQKSYYEDLFVELQDDASMRQEYAQAQFELGEVQSALSQYSEAREAFETAMTVQKVLVTENSTDAQMLASLARTHHELGKLGKKLWDNIRSQATTEESNKLAPRWMEQWTRHSHAALDLRSQVVKLTPEDAGAHRLVASSQESYALAQIEHGHANEDVSEIEKGITLLRQAQEGRKEALERFDSVPLLFYDLARGYGNVAFSELDFAAVLKDRDTQQATWKRATEAALDAIETYESAGPGLLKDLGARSNLANCFELRGKAFLYLTEYENSIHCFEKSIQEMQWVCSRNPLVYRYRKMLSFYQFQLAHCYFCNEQNEKCVEALRDFRATLVEVLRATPENKKAAEWFVGLTLEIAQIVGVPTSENIPILRSILNGTISDLQNLIQASNEYRWLTPKVEKLKSFLLSIEAEAPVTEKTL